MASVPTVLTETVADFGEKVKILSVTQIRRKVTVFVGMGIRKKYHFLLFLRIHNKSTTPTPKCTPAPIAF